MTSKVSSKKSHARAPARQKAVVFPDRDAIMGCLRDVGLHRDYPIQYKNPDINPTGVMEFCKNFSNLVAGMPANQSTVERFTQWAIGMNGISGDAVSQAFVKQKLGEAIKIIAPNLASERRDREEMEYRYGSD